MIGYKLLVTPRLISVQEFAFGGSLRIALQSTARSNYILETYVYHHHKKSERVGFSIHRSDLPSTKTLLSPPFSFTFLFAVSKLSPVSL